ncbi:MAG: phosphatase PAP2 family protein [Solirubrobacteraceae bacterium]
MSLHDLDRRALDLDHRALLLARTRAHHPFAERAAGAYSRLGEHAACWMALGGVGAWLEDDPARRRAWLRGVRVVVGAYGLNLAIKLAVRRPRPQLAGLEPLTPTVSRLSFPSAHATTSFAAARAYRGLAPAAALYCAAGAFALSRPYLGVHYPSDVLAGALIGTILAGAWPSSRHPAGPSESWRACTHPAGPSESWRSCTHPAGPSESCPSPRPAGAPR